MSAKLPAGFLQQGIYCFKDAAADRWTFAYIPQQPRLARDPGERPVCTLLVSDQGGILQLQAELDADPAPLDALKAELATRNPELEAHLLTLEPARVDSDATVLMLHGEGSVTMLATVRPSGIPPYTAIFNVLLDAGQQSLVLAALNGRPDVLALDYRLTLLADTEASVTIAGDMAAGLRELLDAGSAGGDASESLAQIDRALATGQLTFSELTIGDATDELRAQVQQEARQLAARQLMAYANEARAADLLPDRAQLRAVSSQRLPRSYPITLTLDLGLLFADGTGGQHIQVSPTTIAVGPVEQGPEVQQTTTAALPQEAFTHPATSATNPAPPQERRVRLAFDAQNTPVVSVEVESAGKRAKLRRPTFREVGLPAGDGPLRVETNYLVGAAFKRELPAAAEWGLDPAALGLAWLRVDARRVQASGAQRIQVTVRYRPAGSGSSDSKQIQFARGDAEWLTGWYLVTRSDTLAGVIEWSWTETSAEGKTTRHPMAQTENPVLEL